ncbi:MAG: formate dehydrogenase accessory sulfurtransferase FdhD [Saprospiraceae bacterium]
MKSISKKDIIKFKLSDTGDQNQKIIMSDDIVVEEPLEIRLKYHVAHGIYRTISLSVTMRTPGDDKVLVIGFLYTEHIVDNIDNIESISETIENIILVTLKEEVVFDNKIPKRNFYASSSCGLCGKASIESIHSETEFLPWKSKFKIEASVMLSLPKQLIATQESFSITGGIHACATVDKNGIITAIKEDVGRHNAMDKLIGSLDHYPIYDKLIITSGRSSFELVQKASKIGTPVLLSIGAPTSLAIKLAEEHGITLVGFLKDKSFNVYCGKERILFSP